MKKYSSGKAINKVSTLVCPRSHCSSDPYLSNRKIETNPPGRANNVRTRPTPRSIPSASVSPPPRKIRATKSWTSLPNGRSQWYSHSWRAISRIISGSLHDLDDVTRHIHRVDVIDQVQKRVLERFSENLSHIRHRIVRDDHSLPQDKDIGADFLHDLQYVRTVKDKFPGASQ